MAVIYVVLLLYAVRGEVVMLKISMFEFLLRGLPEAFLFVFAAFAISKTKLDLKRYLLASGTLALAAYVIRFLPIQYGVNTILNLFVLIVLMTIINKVDMITAIRTGVMIMIIEYICEGINVFLIQVILKIDMNYVFSNSELKVLYGIPSLAFFGLIVVSYYLILNKRKELRVVIDGEV
jgi:hypothetical protein